MKLTAKYDIEASVGFVYKELADFDAWERMAMRRGAEVTRTDHARQFGPGMEWQVSFTHRNKPRSARIQLLEAAPDSHLRIAAQSVLADLDIVIDLMDLAATRTRIEIRTDIKPKTLAARLYIQTLRLTRKKVEKTYAHRVASLAVDLEDRFRRPGNGIRPLR